MMRLRCEELEERIAPVAVVIAADSGFAFSDADGDVIQITYSGPEGSSVTVVDATNGDFDDGGSIASITSSGADWTSVLMVFINDDAGNGRFDVGSITAAGQDFGTIALGLGMTGEVFGEAVLLEDATVDVGGALGMFATSGDFNCFEGNAINTGEDIGLIYIGGALTLPNDGTALFTAGAGGSGNIAFIDVEEIYYSDGTTPYGPWTFTGSQSLGDDAGADNLGGMTVTVSSGGGEFMTVPVVGGGAVMSYLSITDANANVTITSTGTGYDIAHLIFEGGGSHQVTISGKGPVDVLSASVTGDLASFTNATPGGDLGILDVSGGIGAVTIGKTGNFGTIGGGVGNSVPKFEHVSFEGQSLAHFGGVGSITAGAIVGLDIEADSFGPIKASRISGTSILAHGGIGAITVGAGGILDSQIVAAGSGDDGGLAGLSVKGVIDSSTISTVASGPNPSGGAMGPVTAAAIYDSEIYGFDGIVSLTVKGVVRDSSIKSYFWHEGWGEYLGGSIGPVTVGGLQHRSEITALAGLGKVKIGAGGMTDGSSIFSPMTNDGVADVAIAGSMSDSDIDLGGSVSAIKITGSMVGSWDNTGPDDISSCTITAGSIAQMTVGGPVFGSVIETQGSLAKISVGGDVIDADIVGVGGLGAVSVKGAISDSAVVAWDPDWQPGDPQASITSISAAEIAHSQILASRDIGKITSKGLISDSTIMAVTPDVYMGGPTSGGSIGPIKAAGFMDTDVAAYNNMAAITLGEFGVAGKSSIMTYEGDFAGLKTSGFVFGNIDVAGNLTGSITTAGNDAWRYTDHACYFTDDNGTLTGGALNVMGSIGATVKVS